MVGTGRAGLQCLRLHHLRTVLAAMTALIISFIAGPRVIRWLAAKKIGQAVRAMARKRT
jgi:UDP-N-acetylmuramyl pentapeptide phosphotransferase/UDP-N-acetylglucosamine-1-phosphate transferase